MTRTPRISSAIRHRNGITNESNRSQSTSVSETRHRIDTQRPSGTRKTSRPSGRPLRNTAPKPGVGLRKTASRKAATAAPIQHPRAANGNYYKKVARQTGSTGDNLLRLLKCRLDALVYRSGLARTIYAARQFVTHGHIAVDGERVDVPSYAVRVGQVVSVKEKPLQLTSFQEGPGLTRAPTYLVPTASQYSFTKHREPTSEEIPVICDIRQVVEFYSR